MMHLPMALAALILSAPPVTLEDALFNPVGWAQETFKQSKLPAELAEIQPLRRSQMGWRGWLETLGLLSPSQHSVVPRTTTFDDVAGLGAARTDLLEIVHLIQDPAAASHLGGRMPRGLLLSGPPGTGKTLTARAMAGEAGVSFIATNAAQFISIYQGSGSRFVRELFQAARNHAPAIVFIDEIDAIGKNRDLNMGNSEATATLNALLVEMDGFREHDNILVVAATNHSKFLDPALVRPGRFDRKIVLDLPDAKGRLEIMKVHTRRVPLSSDVDLWAIALATPGQSGAALSNIVNEAALTAARDRRVEVNHNDLEHAVDTVNLGPLSTHETSPASLRRTAYHEAGHALATLVHPGSSQLLRVTIVPRGAALGVNLLAPREDGDAQSPTDATLFNDLVAAMGGRAAEALSVGDISAGCSSDLEVATLRAQMMVTQLGMGPRLRLSVVSRGSDRLFLASENTQRLIDEDVRELLDDAYRVALDTLREHQEGLGRIAQGLLAHGSLTAAEIKGLAFDGEDCAQ
jgi:cell division protease FtsH